MVQMQQCICENCGRSNHSGAISKHTNQQHVAQLCLTCAHVFSLPANEGRFLQLVRKKTKQTSNPEMQKVHKKLSFLLAVAGLFLTIIAAAAVSHSVNLKSYYDIYFHEQETDEYLSFASLNENFDKNS